MKIALVVGINYYEYGTPLFGCINDAYNVKSMLERNDGGSVNFDCKLLTASNSNESIDRADLKDDISKLTLLVSSKSEVGFFGPSPKEEGTHYSVGSALS